MKNLLLLVVAVLATQFSFGQTARLVLVEEFTQASCGPCAAANPAFDALLGSAANLSKSVRLKYQTSWPGYDPMNEQNPAEVQTRVDYYGVDGVPYGVVDGVSIADDCGAYLGSPSCFTQADLNTAAAITSPIEINLTHTFSANYQTVSITAVVTNVSLAIFGGSSTRFHVALIEKQIDFASAPGSNGETTFHNVMRKMLPGANGTTMAAALAPGESVTYTYNDVPVPSYLYNLGQLAVVAFAQNNSSKEVYQAAISEPLPITGLPDIATSTSTIGPDGYCQYEITPAVTITNANTVAITSFTAQVLFNGDVVAAQNWVGSLTQGQSATVTFDPINLPNGGNYVVNYVVNNLNGGVADFNGSNNQIVPQTFTVVSPTATTNDIAEDMESTAAGVLPTNTFYEGGEGLIADFSAYNMFVTNKDALNDGGLTLTSAVGGFVTSDNAVVTLFYNMQSGETASMLFDKVNLSNYTSANLTFDHAYAQYQTENDRLIVEASTNCGDTWTTLFNKAGSTLKTRNATTSFFAPQVAADWDPNTVPLTSLLGQSEVLIRFRAVSAYGNNLWLDNIEIEGETSVYVPMNATTSSSSQWQDAPNGTVSVVVAGGSGTYSYTWTNATGTVVGNTATVTGLAAGTYTVSINDGVATITQTVTVLNALGINNPAAVGFNVYPNPANNVVTITFATAATEVRMIDVTGKVVSTQTLNAGTNQTTVLLDNLANGAYLCQLINNNAVVAVQKLTVIR
jgi:hypothetical protein